MGQTERECDELRRKCLEMEEPCKENISTLLETDEAHLA